MTQAAMIVGAAYAVYDERGESEDFSHFSADVIFM